MAKSSWLSTLRIMLSLAAIAFSSCASMTGSNAKTLTKSERAMYLVEAARAALTESDYTGAFQHLHDAEAITTDLADIYYTRSVLYFMKHEYDHAMSEARHALELKPDYSEANNTLGKLLLDAGKYKEAEKYLLKAANDNLFRDAYKAKTNLGIYYYRIGTYAKSADYLDQAIQDAPYAACLAYYYRGHLRLKDAHFGDAVKDYLAASKHACGGFADAHLALGIAYERSRKYDMARKTFLDVSKNFPNSKVADQAMDRLKYLPN